MKDKKERKTKKAKETVEAREAKKVNPSFLEWCLEKWDIICPKCKKRVENSDGKKKYKAINAEEVEIFCENKDCGFYLKTPWMWHKIKSSNMVDRLLRTVTKISYDEAWIWVNEFKYTNPTYYISQYKERYEAVDDLQKLIKNFSAENVLAIGCNSNEELKVFEHDDTVKNFVCVDISKRLLEWAVERNHAAIMEQHKFRDGLGKVKMHYCTAFIEDLPSTFASYKVDYKNERYQLTDEKEIVDIERFDLCLVLKLLQSSHFNKERLHLALYNVYDKLKNNGMFVISIPKATLYLSCVQSNLNFHSGIDEVKKNVDRNFMPGIYDENKGFYNNHERLMEIYKTVKECGLYENIELHTSNQESYEYYIVCRKKTKKSDIRNGEKNE